MTATNGTAKGTAVVTGASTGLGAIYARKLAERGYDLLLIARSEAKLEQVASEIVVDTGRSVRTEVADLANAGDLERVVSLLRSDPDITLLVNNAGVALLAPIANGNADHTRAMVDLNITALTLLTQAVLPGFVARDRGGIINIASAVAVWSVPNMGVYAGTKAYVSQFTQILADELAGTNIHIQAVMPAATRTPLWDGSGGDIDSFPDGTVMTPEDAVDAALAGWDRGELYTYPSLEDIRLWETYDQARRDLSAALPNGTPASRYLARV